MKEIGKNITVIEYRDEILIVDCGMSFPEDEMFGIDVVIPDFTYLKENMEKIKGLIITHGHEDHIGGVPYLVKEINVPVYASGLAAGLIQHKLKEKNLTADVHVISSGDIIHIGSFIVEAIHTTHSIADSFAFSIKCPAGHIVHTGDFKVDYTPIDGAPIDLMRFAELGEKGVLLLMADSTNAERRGFTMSERTVGATFDDIFSRTKGRLIVATFSSNIHRVQQIIDTAAKFNRKCVICGRSMVNVIDVALQTGYMKHTENTLIDMEEIDKYPPEQLVVITTGLP